MCIKINSIHRRFLRLNIYNAGVSNDIQFRKAMNEQINKFSSNFIQHQTRLCTNATSLSVISILLFSHHPSNTTMSVHQHQAPTPSESREQSIKGSVVSRKSTQKQTLKQQIDFLKSQVKKLKIDNLNQKIMHLQKKDTSYHTIQSNFMSLNQNFIQNRSSQQQVQADQHSEHTEYLMDKKSQNSVGRQPLVHFRVGRIVKNVQNSQQRPDFRQSKTIEVKKSNQSEGFIFNRASNSRLTSDNKNEQIHSEQIFRTIESNHKFSFFEDVPAIAEVLDLKPPENNENKLMSRQALEGQKKRSMVNFDQTIQSAQLPLPVTSEYKPSQLKLNSNIKQKHVFSKSTTFRLPENFSRTSKAQTDKVWFTSTNPEYHQEQVGDTIRDKNINIRKVSYKLKKHSNSSRDPEVIRKQKLLEDFIKQEAENHHANSRYVVGGYQNEETPLQTNVDYEAIKSSVIAKKNFKARVMSKSKVYAQNIEEQLKHKLRGKIIKNFGQNDAVEPEQAQPQSQNQFSPDQLPVNKFSISQMPYFAERPHPKSNQDEIINLTLSIARKLSIPSIKRQPLQAIVIKKFKNCLIFSIPSTTKKVIWYYEGRFYFGEGEKEGEEGYKSGEGLEFIPEKSFYKGQFYENRKHGSGIMIAQKGNIYEGQWSQGHQHGNGKLYDAEANRIYQGEFKNGKFDGLGLLKISQSQLYKGTFSRNMKHGFGVETFKNGDKYKGEYEQGKFHGKGRYKWSNGNIYEGQFVMGLRTGAGKWRSSKSAGDMYIGMYLSDKKHGLGKYCWGDGSMFEGMFQNDEKHGEGILTYKEGKKVHGRWEKNQLVELLSVQNEEEEGIKPFKGEGWDRAELIERIPNEMMRPKRLRNM